jgi:hypothetical protein
MPTSLDAQRNRAPRLAMPVRHEGRVIRGVKRALITIFCVHMVLASWSMYRRIWQILRIDLTVSSATLSPGVSVSYDVITTGEVRNVIRLELVQGTHSETLIEQRSRLESVSAYDPRLWEYTPTIHISRELLAKFTPGPAALRLTGFGAQKLLRTPAPRVRQIDVVIPPLSF